LEDKRYKISDIIVYAIGGFLIGGAVGGYFLIGILSASLILYLYVILISGALGIIVIILIILKKIKLGQPLWYEESLNKKRGHK